MKIATLPLALVLLLATRASGSAPVTPGSASPRMVPTPCTVWTTDLANTSVNTVVRGATVRAHASFPAVYGGLIATAVLDLPVTYPTVYRETMSFRRETTGNASQMGFDFVVPAWSQIQGTAIVTVTVKAKNGEQAYRGVDTFTVTP